MKFKGIIPELKMSEGKCHQESHLGKMKDYPVLSINTSSLFDGKLEYLKLARGMYPKKFLIRKDFIMVPKQIKESKQNKKRRKKYSNIHLQWRWIKNKENSKKILRKV